MNESETCMKLIDPALVAAGWDVATQILRERRFTDGRVVIAGSRAKRKKGKRADYLLRYTRDIRLAVVEAKAKGVPATDGLQQAINYATILGLPFAFATNGVDIIERDMTTGIERAIASFPSPEDLYERWKATEEISESEEKVVTTPYFNDPEHEPRYYQAIAVDRAVRALAKGAERLLLTLATGTGKTVIAFQICYRLWQARWNRHGRYGKPKILYLADRDVLVEDPMEKVFQPFADARHRISGEASLSREMYFATYQAIAEDERRPGLFREFPPDFFDLIIVDECHRGSARADSVWREILNYFSGAAKLGMTATPARKDNRDTYKYFGEPLFQYSLAQGIDDGFLAPYRVRRVLTDVDATGWRPNVGQTDAQGNLVPDEQYTTTDFERKVVLDGRTKAIAKYITRYLRATDPLAKTIVFCVDQEHAQNMRNALVQLNADLVKKYPAYCVRITSDEASTGKKHLSDFQDVESVEPVIATTSDMLTTGVDAPTVRNIVLVRVVNSISNFKQIIGRGTRLRTEYGKWFFTILDFTGTATKNFADPEFDGFPVSDTEQGVDDDPGEEQPPSPPGDPDSAGPDEEDPDPWGDDDDEGGSGPGPGQSRKIHVQGVRVEILADLVHELDADGKRLRTIKFTEYAGDKVRSLYRSAAELRLKWLDPKFRDDVLEALGDRGIDVKELAERSGHRDADPFDLLCHVAFNAPLRTRSERARLLRQGRPDFWSRYTPQAREVLTAILDKYEEHGVEQLDVPAVLTVPPIASFGTPIEIVERFGGVEPLQAAVAALQREIYEAA